jgi:hypothetical protein
VLVGACRPVEMSSKKRVDTGNVAASSSHSHKGAVCHDPRFDDLSGELRETHFKQSSSFINNIRHREKQNVRCTRSSESTGSACSWFEYIRSDPKWIEERYVNDFVGRGVFATEDIEPGEFIVEYVGEFLTAAAGEDRECQNPSVF